MRVGGSQLPVIDLDHSVGLGQVQVEQAEMPPEVIAEIALGPLLLSVAHEPNAAGLTALHLQHMGNRVDRIGMIGTYR